MHVNPKDISFDWLTLAALPLFAWNHPHICSNLLPLPHPAYDQQPPWYDRQAPMIHGRRRSVFIHGLPFFFANIKGESHRRRFGRTPVIADSVVVVGIIGPAREINPVILLGWPRGDSIMGVAGVRRQPRPPDSGHIL